MGFLNKIMFWKKGDEFNFDDFAQKEMGQSATSQEYPEMEKHLGTEEKSLFEGPHEPEPSSFPEKPLSSPYLRPAASEGSRDLELINSKLDTLKAMLNSLEQRLDKIEKNTGTDKKQKLW